MKKYIRIENGQEYSDNQVYGVLIVDENIDISAIEAAIKDAVELHELAYQRWRADSKTYGYPSSYLPFIYTALENRGVKFELLDFDEMPVVATT